MACWGVSVFARPLKKPRNPISSACFITPFGVGLPDNMFCFVSVCLHIGVHAFDAHVKSADMLYIYFII
mgnify:FL=1